MDGGSMRIAGLSARPPRAEDVATALSGATALLGQRPAVTALGPAGRREQGFASLAGWVAKGANLLALELGIGPGGRVAVAGAPGWPLAAVTLSAWWVGATVVPVTVAGPVDVSILHVTTPRDGRSGDLMWFGDALDGTGDPRDSAGEQWTDAVTPHGDRPPSPARDGDLVAFVDGSGTSMTQRALLAALAGDEGGVLGVERRGDDDVLERPDAARFLAALALRPLVTGAATVVVAQDDTQRDAHAQAERITRWYE